MKHRIIKDELEKIVINCLSVADICRKLNIRPVGGNYKTINSKIKKWNINISHFTGKAWNVGKRFKPFCKKISLSEILVENSDYTNNYNIKQKLIKEGLKESKCENCGLSTWKNKPLLIELHHINGNNLDHRIENLKMLCPNCHSQTNTYRKNNNKSAINIFRKKNYDKLKNIKIKKSKCIICRNDKKKNNKKFCSHKCMFKYNLEKANIPTKKDLLLKMKELKSFVQVGKFYNKSDVTIKKWCIKYNILDEINMCKKNDK